MYLFLQTEGLFDILSKYYGYILFITGIVVTVVSYKTGIAERLSKGWQDVSSVQEKELELAKKEVERLTLQIVDLTREVDVRREINRQDSDIIKSLKQEIVVLEERVTRLRSEIKTLNEGFTK